ncbi:MAG: GbsR/MarR family transcriptional regulator [Acidobacteriaceae bacterium]
MELTGATKDFVLHWGEMGTRWGVNRTVAQVHALLYLSTEPLTAEEIAETLSVARSNVSTSLKELQNWQLAQVTHRIGDRRDHFQTSHDVWELFMTVIEQRVEREIEPTLAMLRRCTAEARTERGAPPQIAARIGSMAEFLQELHNWYREMRRLPPATLRSLLRAGVGITRLLPVIRKKGAKP